MNERALQILEQYDLTVLQAYPGRGAVILETEEGMKLVREFTGSRMILPFEQQLTQDLKESGLCMTDCIIPNREGGLVSQDAEGVCYIVKDWPEGKVCETKNREELCRAMGLLAGLHKRARGLWDAPGREQLPRLYGTPLYEEWEKHNRELKKVRNFIRDRRRKGDFERLFLEYVPYFLELGETGFRALAEASGGELYDRACREGHICHGEYVHHNVMFRKGKMAVLNFERCCIDVQLHDICLFLRKILEKHGWNRELGSRMLEAYERVLPLDGKEREYLAIRLYYPEKAWKLANHYYHANKAWIPEKSCEKLTLVLEQEENRLRFLRDVLGFPKNP